MVTGIRQPTFSQVINLLGAEAVSTISSKHIILFGIGGVGGWCAEALIRSGVKYLTIVDYDCVEVGNINRQAVADETTLGRLKVDIMRQRLQNINSDTEITAIPKKWQPGNEKAFNIESYDYILDAIDDIPNKRHLICSALNTKNTLFSCMGAGHRIDATKIRIGPFSQVTGCPLARKLRQEMKKADYTPIYDFSCVYSIEKPIATSGTIAHVVASFGFLLAQLVITDIIGLQPSLSTLSIMK